jgi:hypothetical protein
MILKRKLKRARRNIATNSILEKGHVDLAPSADSRTIKLMGINMERAKLTL